MNLTDLDFNTAAELHELIRQVNMKYYTLLNSNILYLEEASNQIYIAYIIEFRDAYSHLITIFDYDISSSEGKANARAHLFKYISHLQNGLLDTFRKILELEKKSLLKSIPRKDVRAITYQIALKASELRVMDKNTTVDKRIEGYVSFFEYFQTVRKKLTPEA